MGLTLWKAHETIGQIMSAQVADAPSQEVIDDPQAFRNWVGQCKKIDEAQNRY